VTDYIELPKSDDLHKLTWQGDSLTANFNGISGNQVPRPEITVHPNPDTSIRSGNVTYPYSQSFKLEIKQDAAIVAISNALNSLISTIGAAAGDGVATVAKKISEEAMKLLKGKQMSLTVISNIEVTRDSAKDGTDDIFVWATASTDGTVSVAGNGLKWGLGTKLTANKGQKPALPTGAADPTEKWYNAPAETLNTYTMHVEDQTVFRLKSPGSKAVTLRVNAQAQIESLIPADKLQELSDKIKDWLNADPHVSKDDKLQKPSDTGFDLSKWSAEVVSFIDKLAKFIVGVLTPKLLALVVEQTVVDFATLTAAEVKERGIDPKQLVMLDSPKGDSLLALAQAVAAVNAEHPIPEEGFALIEAILPGTSDGTQHGPTTSAIQADKSEEPAPVAPRSSPRVRA
jgi:hypothetical protein